MSGSDDKTTALRSEEEALGDDIYVVNEQRVHSSAFELECSKIAEHQGSSSNSNRICGSVKDSNNIIFARDSVSNNSMTLPHSIELMEGSHERCLSRTNSLSIVSDTNSISNSETDDNDDNDGSNNISDPGSGLVSGLFILCLFGCCIVAFMVGIVGLLLWFVESSTVEEQKDPAAEKVYYWIWTVSVCFLGALGVVASVFYVLVVRK